MSTATRTDTTSPALPAAESHDLIRVQGARVNNREDISVDIPKRRLTVFTGVPSSGQRSVLATARPPSSPEVKRPGLTRRMEELRNG